MCNNKYVINIISGKFIILKHTEDHSSIFESILSKYPVLLQYIEKSNSKENISKHYDLGNDFFSLWLDKTLTYSSAIFDNDKQDLHEAQNNKYQKLINLLKPKENSKVLEIGCGWGGFAEYLGKNFDINLDCITISKKQFNYAKERMHKNGLNEKVNIKMLLNKWTYWLSRKTREKQKNIFQNLSIKDISDACELLRPIHNNTQGKDGFVSIEIDPKFANDTEKSISEGIYLHKSINQPNVMIKVAGTKNGMPVIEHLISLGINVNVTLLFSRSMYRKAAKAYINGLNKLSPDQMKKVNSNL